MKRCLMNTESVFTYHHCHRRARCKLYTEILLVVASDRPHPTVLLAAVWVPAITACPTRPRFELGTTIPTISSNFIDWSLCITIRLQSTINCICINNWSRVQLVANIPHPTLLGCCVGASEHCMPDQALSLGTNIPYRILLTGLYVSPFAYSQLYTVYLLLTTGVQLVANRPHPVLQIAVWVPASTA